MKPFPHRYSANVSAVPEGNLCAVSEGFPPLAVDGPVEFDGPGDQWTPEALLMAAVADCLVLTFRAVAKASGLEWVAIECVSEGVLDKVERRAQFTEVYTTATLKVPAATDVETATRLLHKAEQNCFVSNSLSAAKHFSCEVEVVNG